MYEHEGVSERLGGSSSPVNIAPGDLAFLLNECPREFYDKYRHGIRRPGIFPKYFNQVDRGMKLCYDDGRWHEIARVATLLDSGLDTVDSSIRFRVVAKDGWVTSETLPLSSSVELRIRGIFDTIVELEDGSLAVCDFKTTFPKIEHLWFYRRPLHAYAYACEHPAVTSSNHFNVPRLGLLVFDGSDFASNPEVGGFCGPLTWVELPRTDELFLRFMAKAARLLDRAEAPEPTPGCAFCRFRGLGAA